MAVLEAHKLRKSYGGEEVVAGVSFGIRAGECFGLLGLSSSALSLWVIALVPLAYAAAGFYAATILFRRRLLK